ncbi:hypothetical protein WR25_00476 [Diploscapter pachys]|uniref:Uncharacterized protein n=1 Tax=Diploscapter pachys TaxID=2018661 RepID=A0A2A2KJI0_9BILA|nr:hypothetical protein WR25_00476 [Diploscapter pachys]
MSTPALALFEPIITDTSNATTCSFTYSCDPQYDAFMTIAEDPVSHEPICRIFAIGIPPSPSEYKMLCNTTSNKFIVSGSTYAYPAIACLHYPDASVPDNCQ